MSVKEYDMDSIVSLPEGIDENIASLKNDKIYDKFVLSNLTISTCTVITNLSAKVKLGYLTRFVNIYDQNAEELNLKSGGIYNLEFYGNCARGETLVEKIKDEFNNQATLKFKYWGFRNVNIKVFANGKLQMTGLKYENEAIEIGNLLIDILNNTKINILSNIHELKDSNKTFDFQVVYDIQSKKVFYYRKYYVRFLKNYNFDINDIYINKHVGHLDKYSFNIKRKNFKKGIHDVYVDLIENDNKQFINDNEWYGDNEIMQIIDKIEMSKLLFEKDMETILSTCTTLLDVKDTIDKLSNKYQDFKFDDLDNILNNINKNIYSTDENTLVDIKSDIFQFIKTYKNLLEKKINRLVIIRNIDVHICYNLEKYITLHNHNTLFLKNISLISLDPIEPDPIDIEPHAPIAPIDPIISIAPIAPITSSIAPIAPIDLKPNYYIGNTTTVLINSDFSVNFNINLKKFSKILKKKGLFNTYEPDEHSGINLKYYYNSSNQIQGFCNCQSHCATKEKHSICTKITLLIFRPGSIIITGSRNIDQLRTAHALIIKLIDENIKLIKMDTQIDDNNIALLNNEFRKISRKPRLFYIKKTNLII